MEPATDPSVDYKGLVRAGYQTCAQAYADARAETTSALDLLLARLGPGSDVLDLGCGGGVPVAKTIAADHNVTGVDFSSEQIRLARENVPDATFIETDIAGLAFEPSSFDAVVAFYVIFHLPRAEQLELLRSIFGWLRPGGYLLGTLSRSNEEPYTEDDFFGVRMFWTNFALDEYVAFLEDLGFEILDASVIGHGYDGVERPEAHPLVFARKPVS